MNTLVILGGGYSWKDETAYRDFLQQSYLSQPYNPIKEKNWKEEIAYKAYEKGWKVFNPIMPSTYNARYLEWKIVFEAVLRQISDPPDTIFIGHSLGGCFLLQYISDTRMSFQSFHAVAPCIMEGDFDRAIDYTFLSKNTQNIHFWHSLDDEIVPYRETAFMSGNIGGSSLHTFTDRGHFRVESFSELEGELFKHS